MPDGTITKERKYRGRFYIATFPEAASQTFKAGDFVKIAAGVVSNVVLNTHIPNTIIHVYALENASGTTSNPVTCLVPTDDTEFLLPAGNVTNGVTPATAAWNTDNAHLVNKLGAISVIHVAAGDDRFFWDVNGGTNNTAFITEIDGGRPVGNTGGLVWTKIRALVRPGT